MSDINIPNLRLFVGAMRKVVETLPEAQVVNLYSTHYPSCGTPGCHAGLSMLALNFLGVPKNYYGYYYDLEAKRLSDYLMTEPSIDSYSTELQKWAQENPDLWGGPYGDGMFSCGLAFGKDGLTFPGKVIVDWWEEVLARQEDNS